MKKRCIMFALLWLSISGWAQTMASGEYDSGLTLAYDNRTNQVTGYYENYTGWDEKTGQPRFSCIFYIMGTVTGNPFAIKTFYPNDTDSISGTMQLMDDSTVGIKLNEDHGGCWNVQLFASERVRFGLEKPVGWKQIRYIATDKAYFYADTSIATKRKSYLVQNDFVAISHIVDDWAYCIFYGDSVTKGWIRTAALNRM